MDSKLPEIIAIHIVLELDDSELEILSSLNISSTTLTQLPGMYRLIGTQSALYDYLSKYNGWSDEEILDQFSFLIEPNSINIYDEIDKLLEAYISIHGLPNNMMSTYNVIHLVNEIKNTFSRLELKC